MKVTIKCVKEANGWTSYYRNDCRNFAPAMGPNIWPCETLAELLDIIENWRLRKGFSRLIISI